MGYIDPNENIEKYFEEILLDPTTYLCEVTGSEPRETKKHKSAWSLKYTIMDGPIQSLTGESPVGMVVDDFILTSGFDEIESIRGKNLAKHRLGNRLKVLGITILEDGSFEEEEALGKTVKVVVRRGKSQDGKPTDEVDELQVYVP